MTNIPVSKVTPDFDLLYNELVKKLETKQTWIDLLPTSVGTTIADLFAGSHISNQLYLDIAFRESFLPLAVRDSSIFSGTRMLGVNISRKTPAGFTAELSNYDTTTKYIVPYSTFDVGGRKFFNRSQYVIPPGGTLSNVNLFSGTVVEKTFNLESETQLALKEFLLGAPGFTVSDPDILVYTENVNTGVQYVWEKTDKAIFEHAGDDRVYFSATTKDGDVSLFFGDGTYGYVLTSDEELKVRYVSTDGANGNTGLPGIGVKYVADNKVRGESITSIAGGANEKSALYYKRFAGNMSRTKRRSISGADIRGTIMNYPGVADVAVLGQRDIAPDDLRWMNTVRICILPEEADTFGGANPNPNSAQWSAFEQWILPQLHKAYPIQRWNPEKLFVSVKLKIAILPSAKDSEIRIVAMEEILKLFQKRPGVLGRRLSKSDIISALDRIDGVDYVVVESPTEEIKPEDKTKYVVLDGSPIIDVVYSERALSI
jgi:hypothetical protein